MGEALIGRESYREAINVMVDAIKIDPDCAGTYINWGRCSYLLRDYSSAKNLFKKAIKIEKDNALAHYYFGIYYIWEDNHDLAVNEYKILKEIDKELAEQLFELIFKK